MILYGHEINRQDEEFHQKLEIINKIINIAEHKLRIQ